jgi:ABC-type phosphate/phosphonate transport system substrate-binding protein
VAAPLRFLTYLSPSIPREFFERVVARVEEQTGLESSLACEIAVSGPSRETDPFAADRADFAFVCAPSYPVLRRAGTAALVGAAPVLADPRNGGRPVYFADVVVGAHSAFTGFPDLRGAVWTYNDPSSLSGWYSMLARLEEIGQAAVPGAFFGEVRVSGSHRESVAAVAERRADASAIDSNALALRLENEPLLKSRLRVLETWGPLPVQPLLARRSLPRGLRDRVAKALLSMHEDPSGAGALASFRFARFAPVTPAFYDAFPIMAAEPGNDARPRGRRPGTPRPGSSAARA